MALKDTWIDKVDGVDDVLAKDINDIAHEIIQNSEKIVFVNIENGVSSHSASEIVALASAGKIVCALVGKNFYLYNRSLTQPIQAIFSCPYQYGGPRLSTLHIYEKKASFISASLMPKETDSVGYDVNTSSNYSYSLYVKTDDAPTKDSKKLLTSGTVYDIMEEINNALGSYINDIDALLGDGTGSGNVSTNSSLKIIAEDISFTEVDNISNPVFDVGVDISKKNIFSVLKLYRYGEVYAEYSFLLLNGANSPTCFADVQSGIEGDSYVLFDVFVDGEKNKNLIVCSANSMPSNTPMGLDLAEIFDAKMTVYELI